MPVTTLPSLFPESCRKTLSLEIDTTSVSIAWPGVRERLEAGSGGYLFCDCSPESPTGRRSLCYDGEALGSRKENKPAGSALEMAAATGLEVLTEEEYRSLQDLGKFDRKTSIWVRTPAAIRKLGGALF